MKVSFTFNSSLKFRIKVALFLFITGLTITILFEILNPFPSRTGGGYRNKHVVMKNSWIKDLPEVVHLNYNNVGYFGEDWSDTIRRKKILFIGSSTTLSHIIPHELSWSSQAVKGLSVWYNNAGIDGSGINEWMEEVKKTKTLNPDYIIVFVNPFHDAFPGISKPINRQHASSNFFMNLVLVQSVIKPVYLSMLPQNREIGHKKINWRDYPTQQALYPASFNFVYDRSMEKLNELTNQILAIGAKPIFISHPTPFGNYKNEDGIDFSSLKGSVEKDALHQQFNVLLKQNSAKNHIHYINGYELEKSSDWFYDHAHFNLKGSAAFGKLVQRELVKIMALH